jgi:hypothetical protein
VTVKPAPQAEPIGVSGRRSRRQRARSPGSTEWVAVGRSLVMKQRYTPSRDHRTVADRCAEVPVPDGFSGATIR